MQETLRTDMGYGAPLQEYAPESRRLMILRTCYATILLLGMGTFVGIVYTSLINAIFLLFWGFLFLTTQKKIRMIQLYLMLGFQIVVLSLSFTAEKTEATQILLFVLQIGLCIYSVTFYRWSMNIFLRHVTNAVLILSLLSNAVYVLIVSGVSLPLMQVANTNTYMMLNAGYGIDFASTLGLIRNSGVFYEPGIFQFALSLACLWCIQSGRMGLALYFYISLLSTFSFVGFFNAVLLLTVYIYRQKLTYRIVYIAMCCLGVALTLNYFLFFYFEKTQTLSYLLRLSDLQEGVRLFLERPILGYGPFFVNQTEFEGGLRGNSNGILGILHQFGIFGAIFFLLAIASAVRNGIAVVAVIVASTLVAQNLFQTEFFLVMFFFFFFSERRKETKTCSKPVGYGQYFP